MDWIRLLKAQQADFVQRLKKPKTYDLNLLESQAKGCHSEIIPLWGEALTEIHNWAREQSLILAQTPPPLPSEYPDDPEWGIPYGHYFQRQAEDYLMRAQIVERAMSLTLGKLVKQMPIDLLTKMNLDEEGNLPSENSFQYTLSNSQNTKILVSVLSNASFNGFKKDKIRWQVTQEDVKNHAVLIFICLVDSCCGYGRGEEKPAVIAGFLPNDHIQFCEPKRHIYLSELLYSGGLSFYLESLINCEDEGVSSDGVLIEGATKTLEKKKKKKGQNKRMKKKLREDEKRKENEK